MGYRKLFLIVLSSCLLLIGCSEGKEPLSISKYSDRDILDMESTFIGLESADRKYQMVFIVTNNTGKDINFIPKNGIWKGCLKITGIPLNSNSMVMTWDMCGRMF